VIQYSTKDEVKENRILKEDSHGDPKRVSVKRSLLLKRKARIRNVGCTGRLIFTRRMEMPEMRGEGQKNRLKLLRNQVEE